MAIKTARIVKDSVLRVASAGAFAVAVVIAPVVEISAGPLAGSGTVADPCSQVNTNGSASLYCGVGGNPRYWRLRRLRYPVRHVPELHRSTGNNSAREPQVDPCHGCP